MNDQTTRHTIDDQRQVVVRQVGDVRVTLDMPEGMAVPSVHLLLHERDHESGGRLAALEAFGMTDEEHLRTPEGYDTYWYDAVAEGVEATVWFRVPGAW